MMVKHCDKCGSKFVQNQQTWKLSLRLWADYDGNFQEFNQESAFVENEINKVLERINMMDAAMLENEIYQEFTFFLCRNCRDQIAANPLNKAL